MAAQVATDTQLATVKNTYGKIATQQINLMIVAPFVAYLSAEVW
jgi:hypothetical protein